MNKTKAARGDRNRLPLVYDVNKEIDLTPPEQRTHPWTARFHSPDYRYNTFDAESKTHEKDGSGFEVLLEQWGSDGDGNCPPLYRRCVYVSGWAAGMPSQVGVNESRDDLTLSGIMEIEDLEEFARALLATVQAVRAKYPEMKGRCVDAL